MQKSRETMSMRMQKLRETLNFKTNKSQWILIHQHLSNLYPRWREKKTNKLSLETISDKGTLEGKQQSAYHMLKKMLSGIRALVEDDTRMTMMKYGRRNLQVKTNLTLWNSWKDFTSANLRVRKIIWKVPKWQRF